MKKRILLSTLCIIVLGVIIAVSNYMIKEIKHTNIFRNKEVFEIEDGAIRLNEKYKGDEELTRLIIPHRLNGQKVTTIGKKAFAICHNITKVTIPDSVTLIDKEAFYGCECLNEVEIADGVTVIGDDAFFGCKNLKKINIPDTVQDIGAGAFYSCYNIDNIKIPDGITAIKDSTFGMCIELSKITIPDSVKSIGSAAFNSCSSLKEITLSENVTQIDGSTFVLSEFDAIHIDSSNPAYKVIGKDIYSKDGKKLIYPLSARGKERYSVAEGVTEIDDYTFSESETLAEVIIPDSVTSIGEYTFSGCTGLRKIKMSDNLINIGKRAFYSCELLSSIRIPDGVEYIGDCAFLGCHAIKDIKVPDSVKNINGFTFSGMSFNSIYIDEQNPYYKIIDKSIYSKDGKTLISLIANDELEVYRIPDYVKEIGEGAVTRCRRVKKIIIPESVEKINKEAFEGYGEQIVFEGSEERWKQLTNHVDLYDVKFHKQCPFEIKFNSIG